MKEHVRKPPLIDPPHTITETESRIAELESKRDYFWLMYLTYCERLAKLRNPEEPEDPGWKEEVHRIAQSIGKNLEDK